MPEDKNQNKIRAWLGHRWQQLINRFTPNKIAAFLIFVGSLFLLPISLFEKRFLSPYWDNFFIRISPELIGIGIGVILIGSANKRTAERQLKANLILQMGGPSNEFARQAIHQMKVEGWIEDGSLNGKSFWHAKLKEAELGFAQMKKVNLMGAIMSGSHLGQADLDGAILHDVNLTEAVWHRAIVTNTEIYNCTLIDADFYGVDLTGAKFLGTFKGNVMDSPHVFLFVLSRLQCATMPNGLRYDGRYRLKGDLRQASSQNYNDKPEHMADFYHITLDDYLAGQEWANDNLAILSHG